MLKNHSIKDLICGGFIMKLLSFLPTRWLETLICGVADRRAKSMPADEALRFLFRVDDHMYHLQGNMAVRYGNGLHPKHRHLDYHRFFTSRLETGERVLDVGCGNGALSYDLGEAGCAVLGIDIVPDNVTTAKERHAHDNVRYEVQDIYSYTASDSFNTVVMSNVLEHLRDRPALLRRLQAQTGASRFLIRVPAYERDWRVPLKKELGVEWRLDCTHETEYTMDSFCQEAAEAGLEIDHLSCKWGEFWAELSPLRSPG